MEQLDRITMRRDQMGGRACVRSLRVTVGMLVGQIAAGRSIDDVLTICSPTIPILSAKMCAMRHGGPRSAISNWPADEAVDRYEPIAKLGVISR